MDPSTKYVFQNKHWTTPRVWSLATASMLTSQMILFDKKWWLFIKVLFSLLFLHPVNNHEFRIVHRDQLVHGRSPQASPPWTRLFEGAIQELQRRLCQEYAVWSKEIQPKLVLLLNKAKSHLCFRCVDRSSSTGGSVRLLWYGHLWRDWKRCQGQDNHTSYLSFFYTGKIFGE